MRYSKKYILLTLILGILAIAEFRNYGQSYEDVDKFRGASLNKEVWNPLIAESINEKLIAVTIDNKEYTSKTNGIYMDENLNLMIPINMLSDSFDCSSHLYDSKQLLLEKYADEVTLALDEPTISVNGESSEISSPMVEEDGTYYVSMESVSENLGFSYGWDVTENTATAVNTTEAATNLPYKYDLREKTRVSEVKDQGALGTCWAFASLTALESALMPEENYVFSPDHMSMNNSFQSSQDDGGEYTMGMAYLTAWQGPVLETDDPYGDGVTTPGLSPVKHVQEVQILAEKDFNAVKEAVFKHGGVQTSIYSSLQSSTSQSVYYNSDTNAYCYMGTEKPNHDVVIIGWDDTYSKDNFSMDLEGDGAFICQNSWGNEFGDNGVFYVSYYDTNIGIHNIVYTGVEHTDNYDHIYQSDLCGWVGQLGYNKDTIYGANVYTASGAQEISAAGFYATGVDTSYEVYIVKNYENTDSMEKQIKVAEGTMANAGYYTIDFPASVKVEDQERFAVILKITTPGAIHPLAIEYVADESTGSVDLTDGEGYISQTGEGGWENVESTQQCNLCIKAYSSDQ